MDADNIYRGNASVGQVVPVSEAGVKRNNPFEPMHLLRIVVRGWLTVILLTILGGVAAFIYAQQTTSLYKAEAELEMSVRRPKVINNDAVFDDVMVRDEGVIFNTRFAKFKSPAMERLATQEYFKRYPKDENDGVGKYMLARMVREVQWAKDSRANIVRVSYVSDDPEFTAKLVNVLTHCAGLLMMQENQAISDEAVKWLISQEEQQRDELEEVERQLADIREELQLDSLQQRKVALGQAQIAVTGERENLISRLDSRKTIYEYVMDLKDKDPNLEMLPTGLTKEAHLQEMIKDWRTQLEQLELARSRYKEIHPEYRLAAEKEARARARLEQFIELSAQSVQNEIELLNKQLKQINKRILSMEHESVNLEQQIVGGMQRLQKLERKRDAADFAYQAMLRRMEEARLSADENMAYTKIIRNAEVPRIPVGPKKLQVLLVGLLFGGFAGCLCVLVLAFLLDKIEAVADLRALGLNVLGTVPALKKKVDSRAAMATIGLRDKFSRVVEVFAGVNALISSDKYSEQSRVLLLNSSMPGEGKTICACNLAISSALNGARTLLIDGDLRRPQLVNIFEIAQEQPSLLEWLMDTGNRLSHEKLVTKGVIDNLDVITSRPVRDINPAELLGRSHLAELLLWARDKYDRVIIDSPPLGPVGDAQVLVNYVDSVIMVSRVGKTRRRALRFALTRYREVDAFILGCIANDVPHSLAGMFGGAEGYGYGYGDKSYVQD